MMIGRIHHPPPGAPHDDGGTWNVEVHDPSIGRGSLLSAHRECRSNIVAPVAIHRISAIRPGKEPTIRSWTAQNGVAASSKARKITSLVCMRPIVDSVVAAAARKDGTPCQVTTLARANTGISA